MMKYAIALSALVLAGCGSPSRVAILQHPTTQQTVSCKVEPWGDVRRTKQVEDCIKAYERAGFKLVGDTK